MQALCKEKGVPLYSVASGTELGEWVGLCKLDAEGKPRKVVKTSAAAITDYGKASDEIAVVLEAASAE